MRVIETWINMYTLGQCTHQCYYATIPVSPVICSDLIAISLPPHLRITTGTKHRWFSQVSSWGAVSCWNSYGNSLEVKITQFLVGIRVNFLFLFSFPKLKNRDCLLSWLVFAWNVVIRGHWRQCFWGTVSADTTARGEFALTFRSNA
jgi:hypothetical protein